MTVGSGVHAGEYRPLVAVVAYHLGNDRVSRWPDGGYGVPAPYIEALRRAGARTAIVSPGEPATPEETLDAYDGLLLVGGGDVDPARYGAEADVEHNYGVESDRDEFEVALLRAAERSAVPTLCICRGMQVMNVAYGGTLHQHLPDLPTMLEHGVPLDDTTTLHLVSPVPDSYLAAMTKSGDLECSSHHHQGVDSIGERLRVSGHSPDGLVEAIELDIEMTANPALQPWIVGVQWHPEETAERDPAQQSLFDALVLLARLRGVRAKPGEPEGRSRDFRIVAPDPAWPERFDEEASRIVASLPEGLVTRIDHVGSTSITGLVAKPIVDIQLSLRAMSPRDRYVDPLVDLGYRWVLDPWDVEHEFFSRDIDGERSFHVHVCAAGSHWERRHLLFRDWLRSHPADAAAYGELKRELAEAHPKDSLSYTEAKSVFISGIVERAQEKHFATPARRGQGTASAD
ncbi:MAG: gamma-glutamyl-gamma-aminobutyrate hydrolase family protein [Actinomycetota bacterium]|nr:gamma-glutamyl-gamma-aminobutyrate hydrolase family protein [Actinomycetota bacterium]MDH5224981.1 gamma-glutamyl-gamma-aminobutyrate hydrolase family protein [Actinomycetota bacterium]MDH5313460.1 gamma-glutamyl-gamma-aminobutyrate hydrolase family protein [Actinomycetota bacterium]